MANVVEKDIGTNIRTEAEKSKENLSKFEERLKDYYIHMKKEPFY